MPPVTRPLRDSPVEGRPGESLVAPLRIEGLPPVIEALGRRWRRKVEFHMTVVGRAVIEALGAPWQAVAGVAAGRSMGPICVTRELRRVTQPQRPELQTLVVMVRCPSLETLYEELSATLGAQLEVPPAHVTLYSTDPQQGIGINDQTQLRERAPALSEDEQEEVRRAIDFEAVFGAAARRSGGR